MTRRLAFLVVVLLSLALPTNAQYFGRNKVQWENFHFKTLQTPHFDIYYYDQEQDVVNDVGRMAERWYDRLSRTFNHTFNRKPIVLYANSADFQQTTTTGGLIGEGTGGFTDEFMNRVVLPLTGNYADNDHVLGHELVHVFQYDIAAAQVNSRRRFSLEQMPLWLVEGMAEYFSKGRIDPLTAMWIRDATIHDRLPNLRKLSDPRYFPYRYGEALLAYIGGRFGDEAVVRYFLAAGQVGIEPAFEHATGLSSKQLFADWQAASHELYDPVINDRPKLLGTPVLGTKRTKGDLNVGPALSPDGRYIAFLSTREIFDIDLFLADAKTGRIIRKLVSSDGDPHFDALRFIDSAGSWSPDSRRLAFVVFEKGDNYLAVVDVDSRNVDHIRIPGIDALTAPAWSPDGHTIAFSGQATGVTNLYLYDLDSKQVRQLTNDRFADLQPAWSPDGRTLAFVSDRGSNTNLAELRFSDFGISTIDVNSGRVETLPLFNHAKHIDPHYGPDGSLYFVANPEGIPDIYRYSTDGKIERITHVQTGVSGITETSPALTVASKTGDLAFSLYEDDNYNIYTLPPSPGGIAVAASAVAEAPRGAVLPPFRATGSEITAYLQNPASGLPSESTTYRTRPYDSSLHLAYLGPPNIGIGADRYGYGVGGSVAAEFTDILGRHDVGVAIQAGGYGSGAGSFADQIGGEVYYLNQTHRFNWGVDVVHIPYVSIYPVQGDPVDVDLGNGNVVRADSLLQIREIQTINDVSGIAQYPFNANQRVEVSGGFQRYSYKADVETLLFVGNQLISDELSKLPGAFAVSMFKAGAAFVGDSSTFGFISPVRGSRYRFEAQALTGDLHFVTGLADWRKYFFIRPVTFAVRGLHYGRYGSDADSGALTPLYLGEPGLVRGYDPYSIGPNECSGGTPADPCPVLSRLIGSRIAVASAEVRVPLLGTKEYGLINASFLPTELVAFADAGEAWHSGQTPKLTFNTSSLDREPVYSVGVGVRMLLSYIPLEFYAAKAFQRPNQDIVYGFNIIPGW